MAKQPDLTNRTGDQLTPDGQALQQFIEGLFVEADQKNDMVALNGVLSGHIQHYYTNVYKLRMMTPERWMHDFSESFAAAAWRDMEYFAAQEAQQQQVQETAEQTNALTTELENLKAQLTEAMGKIQALEAAQTEPEAAPRKARKAKPAAVKPEVEADESETGEDSEAEDASEEA